MGRRNNSSMREVGQLEIIIIRSAFTDADCSPNPYKLTSDASRPIARNSQQPLPIQSALQYDECVPQIPCTQQSQAQSTFHNRLRNCNRDNMVISSPNKEKRCTISFIPDDLTIPRVVEARQSALPKHMCGTRNVEFPVHLLGLSIIELVSEDVVELTCREGNNSVVVEWICEDWEDRLDGGESQDVNSRRTGG